MSEPDQGAGGPAHGGAVAEGALPATRQTGREARATGTGSMGVGVGVGSMGVGVGTGSGALARSDLLAYMADMLMELKALADQGGQRTLAGLLALAHAEAMARRDDLAAAEEHVRRASGG